MSTPSIQSLWLFVLLTLAHISFIPELSRWSVIFCLAFVTIYTFGIVLTVQATTATFVTSVYIQGQTLTIDVLVVDALISMAMAVTSYKCGR